MFPWLNKTASLTVMHVTETHTSRLFKGGGHTPLAAVSVGVLRKVSVFLEKQKLGSKYRMMVEEEISIGSLGRG